MAISSGERISIEDRYHEVYKKLSSGKDVEKSPFSTMKDIFMLAACIGFEQGQLRPLEGKTRQIFHWAQLSEVIDVPILKAIAIAHTEDVEILSRPEELIQINEEYANYGIEIIASSIYESIGPLWELTRVIQTSLVKRD